MGLYVIFFPTYYPAPNRKLGWWSQRTWFWWQEKWRKCRSLNLNLSMKTWSVHENIKCQQPIRERGETRKKVSVSLLTHLRWFLVLLWAPCLTELCLVRKKICKSHFEPFPFPLKIYFEKRNISLDMKRLTSENRFLLHSYIIKKWWISDLA
jgi:hypothetical protein